MKTSRPLIPHTGSNSIGATINKGIEYPVKKGDTYFIPALMDSGKLEILKSYL